MAITLLTPAAKPAPQAPAGQSADPGSDGTAAGGDFAALLLGQLAAGAAARPLQAGQESEAVTDRLTPEIDNSGLGTATETSAAQIMATLALVPPTETRASTAPTAPVQGDALTALTPGASTPHHAVPIAPGTDVQANAASTTSTETPLAANSRNETAPAKFAETLIAAGERLPQVQAAAETQGNAPAPSVNLQATTPHAPAARHETTLTVPTPVRDANWNQDFGQKIVWLAGNGKQSAELTLNPPQMGPIEISLNIDKGSATATFVSTNAEVRQSIESALPRLREMLAGAGIELGQANVSAESFRQANPGTNGDGQPRGDGQWKGEPAILGADAASTVGARSTLNVRGNALVDIFA